MIHDNPHTYVLVDCIGPELFRIENVELLFLSAYLLRLVTVPLILSTTGQLELKTFAHNELHFQLTIYKLGTLSNCKNWKTRIQKAALKFQMGDISNHPLYRLDLTPIDFYRNIQWLLKPVLLNVTIDRTKEISNHPLYSSDLAPIDFYLFLQLKQFLVGQLLISHHDKCLNNYADYCKKCKGSCFIWYPLGTKLLKQVTNILCGLETNLLFPF